ncbi:MAG: rhodanese-like domain-containing protein [Bacteriovoracaceae bacterium]|nr:rhodanese-like domain-containing protein [Bacteriovoracaceae bacterium]
MDIIKNYWPVLLLTLWFSYKWWNTRKIKSMLPDLKKKGALLIDVRSEQEFMQNHAVDTINIPLHELNGRLAEIPKEKPIIVCCASGTRSGMARRLLKRNGYGQVYNIGAWSNLRTR